MKKVNLTGKLSLKKETIAKLNNEQMIKVVGGETNTCQINSYDRTACCTAYCSTQVVNPTVCPICD